METQNHPIPPNRLNTIVLHILSRPDAIKVFTSMSDHNRCDLNAIIGALRDNALDQKDVADIRRQLQI